VAGSEAFTIAFLFKGDDLLAVGDDGGVTRPAGHFPSRCGQFGEGLVISWVRNMAVPFGSAELGPVTSNFSQGLYLSGRAFVNSSGRSQTDMGNHAPTPLHLHAGGKGEDQAAGDYTCKERHRERFEKRGLSRLKRPQLP